MWIKRYFTSDTWKGPFLEVAVNYDPKDDSVSDYRVYATDDSTTIDMTQVFETNWPVMLQDMLQETDWKTISHENN